MTAVLLVPAAGGLALGVAWLAGRRRRRRALLARLAPPPHARRVGPAARIARVVVAALAGGLLGGLPLGVLGAAAVVVGAAGTGVVRRSARTAHYDAQVLDFLTVLARAMRSGASPHAAVAEAAGGVDGAAGADLARLHERLERGSTLAGALRRWADERPRPAVRATAAALALGHQTGGLRAEVVDGVAAAVRQRLDVRAEARGLATQARASAVVLAAAPLLFLLLGLVTGSGASEFLLGTPAGVACLVLGLALDAGAFAVMLHLVAGVGR